MTLIGAMPDLLSLFVSGNGLEQNFMAIATTTRQQVIFLNLFKEILWLQ